MKLSAAVLALSLATTVAFSPSPNLVRQTTSLNGFDLSGNSWKPDSERMGSTDTGDYLPEGYNPEDEIAFTSGMMGSQGSMGGDRGGPQLPGMENLGADAYVTGGIEQASEIPAGMEFVPSSVPDGEFSFNVAASSTGENPYEIAVPAVCMTFEDYYAAFSADSHPSLSVGPAAGRMDRRGGEPTMLEIVCSPNGQGGSFTGDLVINLPEDNSKICYKITANSM